MPACDRDEVITLGPPVFRWPVTSALRTVVDLALALPEQEAVVAADSALGGGLVGLEPLRAAARAHRGRSSSPRPGWGSRRWEVADLP